MMPRFQRGDWLPCWKTLMKFKPKIIVVTTDGNETIDILTSNQSVPKDFSLAVIILAPVNSLKVLISIFCSGNELSTSMMKICCEG